MIHHKIAGIVLLWGMAFATLADYNFIGYLKVNRGKLWKTNQQTFVNQFIRHARFIPSDKSMTEFRYALSNRRGILKLDSLVIYEARATFEEKQLNRLFLSIFNRGDANQWDKVNLTDALDQVSKLMTQLYPGVTPVDDTGSIARAKTNLRTWNTPDGYFQLKWSLTGSGKNARPEYLSLTITPDEPGDVKEAAKVTASVGELAKNLKTKPDGSRYLELPMVDQGQKGYCVVAVLERILQYYGSEFDQHQLAQLAQTSTEGTTLKNMLSAIKKADNRLGIKMRQLYLNDDFSNHMDFQKLLNDYNRIAKRQKKKTIKLEDYGQTLGNTRIYNVGQIIMSMDSDIYRSCREKDRRNLGRFQENIRSNIDRGVPLGWCVLLGLIKESKIPQVMGGHMRIICGYNDTKNEIIYTDSWGYGHEFKTMSYVDAWAMSTWLGTLVPREK